MGKKNVIFFMSIGKVLMLYMPHQVTFVLLGRLYYADVTQGSWMSPVTGLDALRRQHTKALHQMIRLFTLMVFALPQQGCESQDVVSTYL